jgi:threonine/homoserine/homoserine lactone efflux protein
MIEIPQFWPFALTCLLIELTPGPNMAYLAILTTSEGRRAGFSAVAGVALGLLLVGLSAAVGLATLISESPLWYEVLRWAGVFYLLWLSWEGWRVNAETSPGKAGATVRARYFYRGLITNLLNPKAAIFYIAILPGFLNTSAALAPQGILLTCIYVSIATAIHSLIVFLAHASRRFFESRNQLYVRRALSLLLALVALWFGWKTAR